jgi:hypothetical protein
LGVTVKYVVVAVLIILVGIVALFAWMENPSAEYESFGDAVRAGAVGPNGWIPEFLPKSAEQIVERHNIDTNESSLTFQFSGSDLHVPDSCVKIPSQDSSVHAYTCNRRTELGGFWSVSTCKLLVGKRDASFSCGSDTLEPKTT